MIFWPQLNWFSSVWKLHSFEHVFMTIFDPKRVFQHAISRSTKREMSILQLKKMKCYASQHQHRRNTDGCYHIQMTSRSDIWQAIRQTNERKTKRKSIDYTSSDRHTRCTRQRVEDEEKVEKRKTVSNCVDGMCLSRSACGGKRQATKWEKTTDDGRVEDGDDDKVKIDEAKFCGNFHLIDGEVVESSSVFRRVQTSWEHTHTCTGVCANENINRWMKPKRNVSSDRNERTFCFDAVAHRCLQEILCASTISSHPV